MDISKELESAAAALVSAGRYEDAAAVVTAGNQWVSAQEARKTAQQELAECRAACLKAEHEAQRAKGEAGLAMAQRDGLVATLENMVDAFCGKLHDFSALHQQRAETSARKALASVKSGEAVTAPQPPAQDAVDKAVGQWQPIETAPKDGRLLATMKNGATSVIIWLDADHPDADQAGWHEHWQFDPVEPTHWMPLPVAPAIDAAMEWGAA